jgi:aminotransferase in exopolysaccharide biosynthesis
MIPLSVPDLGGNEWLYVKECLDSGWVSSAGTFVDRFEHDIAEYTGAKYAVACSSGTAALHVALGLAGVRAGDEVLVPTVTFIASVNAVRYVQAEPVFVDCDEFYNMDTAEIRRYILENTRFHEGATINKSTGSRIAAVLPVHVFGNAVWLDQLIPLCRERGIAVIEDAAESLGTRYSSGAYSGRHTGTVGDLGCLSFNGNKIITTGGGGMILTDSWRIAERARYLTTQAKNDDLRFIHDEIGYNYRLTNVAAALGLAQLEQLPVKLKTKRTNYVRYRERLAGVEGLRLADPPSYADNNHWMYALQIDSSAYGMDVEGTMKWLAFRGVQTRPLWQLNHLQKPYLSCRSLRIERADRLWHTSLCLPCSTSLTAEEVDQVARALESHR